MLKGERCSLLPQNEPVSVLRWYYYERMVYVYVQHPTCTFFYRYSHIG